MFHANEACKGRGTLTVKDGKMSLHVSMPGKNILNLYAGSAAAAKTDTANWLNPTDDTVVYEDGYSEQVLGFDVPVEILNEEFELALVGKKGIWYDHKVKVTDVKFTQWLAEGLYDVETVVEGGSGKVSIISPSKLAVKDGKYILTIVWSSSNYDYMIVDGERYLNETPGKKSTFTFPVKDISSSISVKANTTAMSMPHEIDYEINIIFKN